MLALMLNWMYNDLGGSDVHYIVRNLINALALVVAATGTIEVAMYDSHRNYNFNTVGHQWLAIKAATVFTTLQIQDLRDQAGDLVRARSTVPLSFGDSATRWTIAIPVMFWSLFCPFFWRVSPWGYFVPLIGGSVLSFRVLMHRGISADQNSWRLWGIWTFILVLMPLP